MSDYAWMNLCGEEEVVPFVRIHMLGNRQPWQRKSVTVLQMVRHEKQKFIKRQNNIFLEEKVLIVNN